MPRSSLVPSQNIYFRISAWILTGLLLFLVLVANLLTALLAGLLVYELVRTLTPFVQKHCHYFAGHRSHMVVVLFLSAVVIGLLMLLIFWVWAFFSNGPELLTSLQEKLITVVNRARNEAPAWIISYFPANIEDINQATRAWLQAHRATVQLVGKEALEIFVHLFLGMVLGAMVALHAANQKSDTQPPLARALLQRAQLLSQAFGRVVFAQVKISAINTLCTGIFLAVILPLAGVQLPLIQVMIMVTFLAGLLPVIGNLISNTVIVIISLSVSLPVAIACLIVLILIHKLEYFLNAHIIGTQINASSWELLIAMLLAEAVFGLPGLVAAPIYYAYIKSELQHAGWV